MTEMTRKGVVEAWAQKMAALCEGPDAGWSIYYDWLSAFLAAVERPEAAEMMASTTEALWTHRVTATPDAAPYPATRTP